MSQHSDKAKELRETFAGLRAELRRLMSRLHPEDENIQVDVRQLFEEIANVLIQQTPLATRRLMRDIKEAADPAELWELRMCVDEFEALQREFEDAAAVWKELIRQKKRESG